MIVAVLVGLLLSSVTALGQNRTRIHRHKLYDTLDVRNTTPEMRRKVRNRRLTVDIDSSGIAMYAWGNECYFKINLLDRMLINANFYEQGMRNGHPYVKYGNNRFRFRMFINQAGSFEFDAIIRSKSPNGRYKIPFNIDSRNLSFYYQDTLTQAQLEEGFYRPDSVVGSYAVYHSSKRGNHIYPGGVERNYGTGKAFHVYRPKVWDAAGDTIWGFVEIDTIIDRAWIGVDSTWKANAVHPVTIDPVIGNTIVGGTAYADFDNFCWSAYSSRHKHQAGPTDSIVGYNFYGQTTVGTETVDMAMYSTEYSSSHPNDRLAANVSITVTTTTQWHTAVATQLMNPDSVYVVAVGNASNDDVVGGFLDGVIVNTGAKSNSACSMPSTWSGSTLSDLIPSAYATYRATGFYYDYVRADSDDCLTSFESGGLFTLSTTNHIIGHHASFDSVGSGERWLDVNIPQGATIDSAWTRHYMTIKEGGTSTPGDDVAVMYWIESADNAVTFTDHTNFLARNWDTSSTAVRIDIPGNTSLNEFYKSPDLKDLIQVVVDRGSWSSGNAMAIAVIGDEGTVGDFFRSVDFNSNNAQTAELEIWWTVAVGGDDISYVRRIKEGEGK